MTTPGKPQVFQWQVDIIDFGGDLYTPEIDMTTQNE